MKGELTDGGSQPQPGLAPPDMSEQSQPTIVRAPPPPAGSMAASGSGPKLTKDDALEYLKKVKERFQDHKEKYIEFLQLMKEFKSKSMDRNGVIIRVEELFEGNHDLLLGFNNFLPEACEIKLDEWEYMKWDEAIKYLDKIRELFGVESAEYKTFFNSLTILKEDMINSPW